MRTKLLLFFLSFLLTNVHAINEKDTTVYKVYAMCNDNGLYGYVNRNTNTWVVPPCMHMVDADSIYLKKGITSYYFFGEVNGKQAIVDMDGDFLIPPVYDAVDAVCLPQGIRGNRDSYYGKFEYNRHLDSAHTAVCMSLEDDLGNYKVDLYDLQSGRKICTLKKKFHRVTVLASEKYGRIMYCDYLKKKGRKGGKYVHVRGLADFDGNILWEKEERTYQLEVAEAGGMPVFNFSYFGKRRTSVDAFGNEVSVKYTKGYSIDENSAKKSLDKICQKNAGYQSKLAALMERGRQFTDSKRKPIEYGNYQEMMEALYDKCQRLESYGDNTILTYGGKYGLDYQGLGFALYCEYDKIQPIPGHKGLYGIKRAGKWGIANELQVTVKCQFDTLIIDKSGIKLSLTPKYAIYNNKTKEYMKYIEEVDSAGYSIDSNLREMLTSNYIRKKDNHDNFYAIIEMGKSMGRHDILSLTYYYKSCVYSLRGDKKMSKFYRDMSSDNTSNLKLVETIAMSWFTPVSDEYWQQKIDRLDRINRRLEGWTRVLDAVNTALAPLAANAQTQKSSAGKSRQRTSYTTTSYTSSFSSSSSSGSYSTSNSELLKAKKKYAHYENLLSSYVNMFNGLWARISAGNVLAYGLSERQSLSEYRSKIKEYLNECVSWRQAAARAGGSIAASPVEAKASSCLSRQNPK